MDNGKDLLKTLTEDTSLNSGILYQYLLTDNQPKRDLMNQYLQQKAGATLVNSETGTLLVFFGR